MKNGAGKAGFGFNNVFSGFIVAVIALPLCIAFAIASGASPMAGIVSGVVGGLIAALAGSSRYQVSGPAAAFITLIYGIVAKDGMAVLLAATFVGGVVLLGIAALRLGRAMELMPHPVIVGFTTGIGVLIFLGQIPVALGIDAKGHNILAKLSDMMGQVHNTNPNELIVVGLTLGLAMVYNKLPFKRWLPTPLVALGVSLAAATQIRQMGGSVRTIGSLYDVSPSAISLSGAFLSEFLLQHHSAILLGGLTLGTLTAVETLLSAKALDRMTRSTHNPDRELLGVGLANLVVPFLGGIPVSGVIVRGSANVMSGATARLSAVLHAVFLALFVAFFYNFIKLLPMAGLAAVLLLTALRLIEVHEVRRIVRIDTREGLLAALTVVLTVTIDLTASVPLGLVLMIVLALKRMLNEKVVNVREDEDGHVFAVRGSVNFLTAPSLRDEFIHHLQNAQIRVVDLCAVHYMDTSGAMMLAEMTEQYEQPLLWIANHEQHEKLRHAGIPPERMRVIGNPMLHMPRLFRELTAGRGGLL